MEKRFGFGENWGAFLDHLDEARIAQAEKSLVDALGMDSLKGRSFLDAGCGSGLFSLAARRLGASVHSFDFDPQSAECARRLKTRFFPDDENWTIEEGSVLDAGYLASLGGFDVVYSWGVLHHTGAMWDALRNIADCVADGGLLMISIYNDQGPVSSIWKIIKKTYNRGPLGRAVMSAVFLPWFFVRDVAAGLVKSANPMAKFTEYKKNRGMSIYHDWIDWLGGYPFEAAKPEEVFRFYAGLGFTLRDMTTTNRHGCNEFVFARSGGAAAGA